MAKIQKRVMKKLKTTLKALMVLATITFLFYVFGLFQEAIENIPTDFAIGFRANS